MLINKKITPDWFTFLKIWESSSKIGTKPSETRSLNRNMLPFITNCRGDKFINLKIFKLYNLYIFSNCFGMRSFLNIVNI